ncbi:MAG TPA: sugar phosphate nucleotidyltransferase [Chitinispirillaceae bacterium]|nr:sugar phosphate nucleotidyltransferase [Chitinispirillaceae bacterium]
MRGFILAAGFGTRLRPLTDHVPKAMVRVAGKPLLGHALEFFAENGIESIGVNTHYLPEQIDSYCNTSGIRFEQFHETGAIRGTGGALHFARDFLEGDESFVISNADIIARYSFADAKEHFERSDAIAMLITFPAADKGSIFFNADTFAYTGTPGESVASPHMECADFIGTVFYKREFLKYVKDNDFSVVPIWLRAVKDGAGVIVRIIRDGFWRDVGSPQALLDIHCEIIDQNVKLVIPDSINFNPFRKKCLHRSIVNNGRIGEYSWIESPQFPSDVSTFRVVSYEHAEIGDQKEFKNCIITPWGVISAV